VIIHPFRALRATPASAPRLASVPYDVVDTPRARALAAGNPQSFLHVVRSEIDLPEGTDPYGASVYSKAAENLQALRAAGHLVVEAEPSLYAYRLVRPESPGAGPDVQLGLVACCSVDDYERGVIKKHELTRQDKEDDRTRHILSIQAQAEPVLVAFADRAAVSEALAAAAAAPGPALLRARDEAGVQHEVWRLADAAPVVQAFQAVAAAYIADGHHRSASAARARSACRAENPRHSGDEEYNFFLAVLFPAAGMRILAYNRVVRELNGLTPQQVLQRAAERFDLTEATPGGPQRPGQFQVFIGGRWQGLQIKPRFAHAGDPVRSLDCSLIHEHFIEPILGVGDVRTDPRIKFVGGDRPAQALEKEVAAPGAGVAFALYPTRMSQLMAVADAGQIMPPKSTWFDPKLRSGLVVHSI
jgi:uncharacterized protein (DUF1015 family)